MDSFEAISIARDGDDHAALWRCDRIAGLLVDAVEPGSLNAGDLNLIT